MNADKIDPGALSYRWKAAIVSAAAFSFVCKILLAWNTFGTNDDYTWQRFSFWARLLGAGVYRANPDFNHPPSMIHVLRVVGWLADTTGVFFPFWMRLPAILADVGSLWIVWRIFESRLDRPSVRWTILLVALSPALILISGFHGNTDSEMIFFVLLSVWLTEKGARDWAAGAALGAALCIKVVPLILIPLMLFHRSGMRRRVSFLVSLVATMVVLWSPYIFEDPRTIFHAVFGYGSSYGVWGLSWLLQNLAFYSGKWQILNQPFYKYGAYFIVLVIAALSVWKNHQADLFLKTGALLLLFLAATNGFGWQYLAWIVPWTAGLGVFPAAIFFGASGMYLFLAYNYLAGGLPWYLADANYTREHYAQLDYTGLICWLSVVLLAWSAWRQLRGGLSDSPIPTLRVALLCLLSLPVLVYPALRLWLIDSRRAPFGDVVTLRNVRGEEYVDLAAQIESLGRNWGTIGLAGKALALQPHLRSTGVGIPTFSLAVYWNLVADGYAKKGMWDESIAAAGKSLLARPTNEARAILDRALAQKRLSSGVTFR